MLDINWDDEQKAPLVYDAVNGPSLTVQAKSSAAWNLPVDDRAMGLVLCPWWEGGGGYSYNMAFSWGGLFYRRSGENMEWYPWQKIITTERNGTVLMDGNVGIGVSYPQHKLEVNGTINATETIFTSALNVNGNITAKKLDVNGVIRATEIRVETQGADFVFQRDYKLPALQDVKTHIEEHKHLPGIPSAAEMREHGMGVSEATTKLLQKVEELTLYAIQQNEKIEALSNEIKELKDERK